MRPTTDKEISELNFKDLYKCFLEVMELEHDGIKFKNILKYDQVYKEVENGKYCEFPVYVIVEGYYNIYPKSKSVDILGYGKYNLELFIKDRLYRQNLMQDVLQENKPDPDTPTTEWGDE